MRKDIKIPKNRSIALTEWLKKEGLVYNKVVSQVAVPKWIFSKKEYMANFLRGFFDTDGSVYKLCFGAQISFTNISKYRVYLTKRENIINFFEEIKLANPKHLVRFKNLMYS
ncbi:MAG: LAGLIDADG family homing endonuclease [bacterium]|nr:LAGLIDADG family homing endonuclease [bacterium]